ncbi:hypothetical protein [Flavobacterium sedimenticola]|uniref:Hydrolase n=1 Tax=Flavobacterium sedimenticola TaxID=3043286 RepID=A0ABT6XTN8_9FLAO|nr:hypothetical protein [Flavobacterium sedimenticola]MDI9258459.1 hypothetical protein [Flavobacterium sedimenticola]
MRKSLFLYLFIIAVLMNLFTYKYFSSKDESQLKALTSKNKELQASMDDLNNKLSDANAFSLEYNDRAQNYLNEGEISDFTERVTQALLAYNDAPEGNKYTDQAKISEQKFIITKVKLLNHRWIMAQYSNGKLWGEVLLKYFVNEDKSISFEVLNSYLYPEEFN